MRKCGILAVLLPLVLLLAACGGEGTPVPYEAEHKHVYGYWYDSTEQGVQVRYCKICQQEQTREAPAEP